MLFLNLLPMLSVHLLPISLVYTPFSKGGSKERFPLVKEEGKGLLPFDKEEKIILPFEKGELEGLYFLDSIKILWTAPPKLDKIC